ncbi:MAG: fibronectin type III domain-containing protein [Thermotogaceae bacterium]|nr:fibronectin type III domain-containing protein [Thermotogaceae bacterium]
MDSNTTYYYRVKAYNVAGDSGYSNEASATTSIGIPQAPTDLNATALSSTQIKLTWQDASTNETGFKVERKTGSSGSWSVVTQLGFNATEYTDEGLTPETTYHYRIKAYNAAGDSGYSNEASATTSIGIPQAPTDLNATALSSTQIKLTWQDASTNETGFKVERKTGSSGSWNVVKQLDFNTTEYTDEGLTPETTYYYRVKAYNAAGDSEPSNEIEIMTLFAAPQNLTARSISYYEVELAWEDKSNIEQGYKVERREHGTSDWTEIKNLGANATVYTDDNAEKGKTYDYRVAAYKDVNASYSNEVSATVQQAWERRYGTTNDDAAYCVAQTDDGGYLVVGSTLTSSNNNDLYIMKLDSAGSKKWEKIYTESTYDEVPYAMQKTSDGNYIIAGYTTNSNGHGKDVYVVKIDVNGNKLWEKTHNFASNYDEEAYDIQQTSDGGYIVVGRGDNNGSRALVMKLDQNGNKVEDSVFQSMEYRSEYWNYEAAYSVKQTPDGGYLVAGEVRSSDYGKPDCIYIRRFNSYGGLQWEKGFTDTPSSYARSLDLTEGGGFVVAGQGLDDQSNKTVYVAKYNSYNFSTQDAADSGLQRVWKFTDGSTGHTDSAWSIKQTTDGGFIVTGDRTYNGKSDAMVYKLNSNGSLEGGWTKQYGATDYSDSGRAVLQTVDGGYIVVGYSYAPGSQNEFYILKLDSKGYAG